MKSFKALLVLALILGMAAPVYAETQNVKVSGSIDAYSFWRENFDLTRGNDASVITPITTAVPGSPNAATAANRSNADSYFMTNTQVEVAADLTDNVSTVINIVNERDWNSTTATAQEFDMDLDLAYVQMKEIFYSPLTLKIGRQDIWFGRGFIIGLNNSTWDNNAAIQANEYSVTTAFDAIRATLDFSPWTLDFVYSKIQENNNGASDDTDLYALNVNYKFSEYNAVAEGYYVGQLDRTTLAGATGTKDNDTHTIGGRVQFDPISQITLGGELAYQLGNYRGGVAVDSRDRDAWAGDLFGTYRWDNAWKPELTLEYVHFSGENDLGAGSTASYGAWNMLYRGKFWTAYADFREILYATGDAGDPAAGQNQDFIQVKGALKPLEDLLLEASFTYLWTPANVHLTTTDPNTSSRSKELGWELDLQGTYDYTEDVSFGLLAGWFVPGAFYSGANDETAVDVVSSVKVSF